MTAVHLDIDVPPALVVDVLEPGAQSRDGAIAAVIGQALQLDTEGLESYFFADWDAALVDLLVVAAAAEYCDFVQRRPQYSWTRRFDLRVSVHDPARWSDPGLKAALEDALSFLTGDVWRFSFVARTKAVPRTQTTLDLAADVKTIMPYSDGLDS
ncbi:MAG TPA: hypothetical protein VFX95_10310, partial [Caulobacteraceae bacterium]|nr:hypothetical protein [Caulobacteraceae bacterium]